MAMKELIFGNNIQPALLLNVFKIFVRTYPRGDIFYHERYKISLDDSLGYVRYLITNKFLTDEAKAYYNFDMSDKGEALLFMTIRGWALYHSLRNDEQVRYAAD